MKITAKNSEEFMKFEQIVHKIGYKEDARIKVYHDFTSIVIETEDCYSRAIWISKELDIDSVSVGVVNIDGSEFLKIDTTCILDGETITLRNYAQKDTGAFVKSLSKVK